MGDKDLSVTINRAPVLTLWAAVVAERLGLDQDEALTVGRALSGLTAHAKGVRLGIFEPSPEHVAQHRQSLKHGDTTEIRLMGRNVEAIHTPEGLRAVSRGKPIKPAAVRKYLAGKFGDALGDVQGAMEALAASMPPEELARQAFGLYEEFRPAVKSGAAGWGQEGKLDLAQIRNLCGKKS
jgi:hypothetical protein